MPAHSLLAIDLGLKMGLALYGQDGRLRWYRSQNIGTMPRLRRSAPKLLGDMPDLAWLIIEGSGPLAKVWERAAERRGIAIYQISAENWRQSLMIPRQRRNAVQAKKSAANLAQQIIAWSNAPRPTSLRHDAAEAILVGLWGVLKVGWLDKVPIFE